MGQFFYFVLATDIDKYEIIIIAHFLKKLNTRKAIV